MEHFVDELLVTVIATVTAIVASNGFWTFISNKYSKTNAQKKLLLGIAHDRLLFIGHNMLKKGSITSEEYENLYEYLYKPYLENGGNGTIKLLMENVRKLPLEVEEGD